MAKDNWETPWDFIDNVSREFPRLGCSNDGLSWSVVRPLIYEKLNNIDCEITIYSLE